MTAFGTDWTRDEAEAAAGAYFAMLRAELSQQKVHQGRLHPAGGRGNWPNAEVEVKTTGLGKYFPFVVTTNEVRCSEHFDAQYSLYRVFDFSCEPRLYMLDGSLTKTCPLEATQYRARPK